MQWFKNLDARPRLLISFGVLILLTVAMGILSIENLSKANQRVDSLYRIDMVGSTYANQLVIDVEALRGDDLNAMARAADSSAVASSERDELATMAQLHSDLSAAENLFVNKEGIANLDIVRNALPDYERAQSDLFRSLKAHENASAEAALATVVQYRAVILNAAKAAKGLKEDHAQSELQANNQAYQASRGLLVAFAGISLGLGLILSFVIARGFSQPLSDAVTALEKVASGDLTADLDIDTNDEVGRMASALNRALANLRSTLKEVTDDAINASSASQQLAAAAQAIAGGAQEQAASLEETSASLEEITATVRQSADNARQASQLASGSKEAAEQGQGVVSNAVTAMAEINAASAKISDIISTIDEIAFQTNLLAVNAAVEAARAGEEGRGFAVVAAEVRSLAQRSAEAAKEIKGLIQDSLRKVERGSELVNKSGETLHAIVSSVKRVTDIVGEIAAAAGEQSTGIEQVNTAMMQMDQVTQSNSAQTEELSSTAESLSEQSGHLMEQVRRFIVSNDAKEGRSAPQAKKIATVARASAATKTPARFGSRVAAAIKKAPSAAPAVKSAAALQPVTALASAGEASDSNFEEF